YSKYNNRAYLVVADSGLIADSIANCEFGPIKDGKVDFAYIDARHEYEYVKSDMNAWWDLISDDGILAGHDYDSMHPGVMQAVDEFEKSRRVQVYYTPDHPNSWYIYKNGLKTFEKPRF